MAIPVFIDSCAWDWLFARQVDLSEAFPSEKYALFVTREVEIELASIPDEKDGKDKRPLKLYIAESCAKHSIRTTSVFGFASVEADGRLSRVQVYGGFGQGTFQSDDDRRWYGSDEVKKLLQGKAPKGSGLSGNQADASLESFRH